MDSKILFMATVERGLEDFCMDDLARNFGVIPEHIRRPGKIFFWGAEETIYLINFLARSINRLYIVLEQTTFETLRDIVRTVREIEWDRYIGQGQTFAVRANRIGKHNFTSIDMARETGSAIIEAVASGSSKRPKVNLNNPDVRILIEASHNNLLIGIDTTGRSLHMRGYRVFSHPYALKTTIAYSMVIMSNWDKDFSLLDPTCGGATIPIEAALYAKRTPHFIFRDDFAFRKLRFLDKNVERDIHEEILGNIQREMRLRIFAIDKNRSFLEGARRNLKKSNTAGDIKLIHGDATRLHKIFEPESIDAIVHNPPYHGTGLKELYRKILESELRVIRRGGRIVIITPKRWFWKILDDYGLGYRRIPIIRERNYLTYINIIQL